MRVICILVRFNLLITSLFGRVFPLINKISLKVSHFTFWPCISKSWEVIQFAPPLLYKSLIIPDFEEHPVILQQEH